MTNPECTDRFLATACHAATDASSSDPQTVLHAAYDAITRGDFDALGESMIEDAELNVCGFPTADGNRRGRNDVVAAARRNYAQIENQQPEIEAMISHGESIAVLFAKAVCSNRPESPTAFAAFSGSRSRKEKSGR